jgi:hypothetical protein
MLDSVRDCSNPVLLDKSAQQLATARDRYPSAAFWPILQTEIEARRKAIDRASKDKFVANIRECFTQNDFRTARERLQAARNRHPDDNELWNGLSWEIERQAQAEKREEQPISVDQHGGLLGASSEVPTEIVKTRFAVVGGGGTSEHPGEVDWQPVNGALRTYREAETDSPSPAVPTSRVPEEPAPTTEILIRRPVIKWLIVCAAGITVALTTLAVISRTGPVPLRVDPNELDFTYPGESLSRSLTLAGGRRAPQVVSSDPSWLIASIAANTNPPAVKVQVNPTGLTGDRSGKLTIHAGDDPSEIKEVKIILTEKPKEKPKKKETVSLKAIPETIFFPNYRIGDATPRAQVIAVESANPADGLHFSIASPPSCGWLNFPASGTTPARFKATVNTSLLRPDTQYTCTLTIESPDVTPARVTAALAVFPPISPSASSSPSNPQRPSMPSTLSVSPSSLPFGTYQLGGPTPPPQSISVSSSNPATGLEFSAVSGTNCGWLNLSETRGKTSSQLTALVNTSVLAVGNYSCAITFSGADSNPPPVVATLTVVAPPAIVDCHAPTYTGLHHGTFTWSGRALDPKAELVIGGPDQNLGDGGTIRGQRLPGCDVSVTAASGVVIEEGPSTMDGFRRIKVRNGSNDSVSSFEIRWQAK